MSVYRRDFSTYELGDDVYQLAGDLIPEIAEVAQYPLSSEPNEQEIRGFIGALGPEKELQRNIEGVEQRLGSAATETVANWIDRSGIMNPLARTFAKNEQLEGDIQNLVIPGGVARWMLRRASVAETIDPFKVQRVFLLGSNRIMSLKEHQIVKTTVDKGEEITEFNFAEEIIRPRLEAAGFKRFRQLIQESDKADDVLGKLFSVYFHVLGADVTLVSNAPNAIQAAGQFRHVARQFNPGFDENGNQLSVVSDWFPLARNGEGAATHQNPFTALGQLAQNALFLHLNSDK